MIKFLLACVLFYMPLSCISQTNSGLFGFYNTRDRNQFISICAMQLLSGTARGYEQVVTYHYSAFKKAYPGANDYYFDPSISWENKYKDHNPADGPAYFGSTTVLAWTTDFKHLMDITSDVPNYVCITIPLCIPHGKLNWKQIVARGLVATAAREVGFNMIYSVIYK